jgi:hypothetical protein
MKGTLKHDETEWLVTQEGQDRAFPIHPEQQEDMHVFDTFKQYHVEYNLCFLVEFRLYCVKLSKSSFPKPEIEKTHVNATSIEIINDDESFYIGQNLDIEVGYENQVMKVYVSQKTNNV